MSQTISIGIIGFGRFGKLMARYLALDFPVTVYDIKDRSADIARTGARTAPLPLVCEQDIVILSVPISALKDVLKETAPMFKKDVLVVDVCSVKEYPVQWMKEILPESVSILGTHPMFGPDSAAESLEDRKIVLCRERIDSVLYEKVKDYLSSKGLIVIETNPKIHDQHIAVTLALTHFIGRSLSEFGATEYEIDTEGYKRLIHTLGVVEHDTWQLFSDMHRFNRYAGEKRKIFMQAVEKIDKRLKDENSLPLT